MWITPPFFYLNEDNHIGFEASINHKSHIINCLLKILFIEKIELPFL
jgi:hypothetical protein